MLYGALQTAALANGYTLWVSANAGTEIEFLAVPSGASHATPEALMAAFSAVRWGLPRPPRRRPSNGDRRVPRNGDDGMTTYRLDGSAPPVLLTFIDKLS